MESDLTQSELWAMAKKNRRNIERQGQEIQSACLIMIHGKPVPPPPPGWSDGRWRAAITTSYNLLTMRGKKMKK